MDMTNVSSSNIKSIGYNPESKELKIMFNKGGVYSYSNVPAIVFGHLMKSESKGKFFYKNIKGKYPFERL